MNGKKSITNYTSIKQTTIDKTKVLAIMFKNQTNMYNVDLTAYVKPNWWNKHKTLILATTIPVTSIITLITALTIIINKRKQ